MVDHPYQRSRIWLAGAMLLVVAVGLVSRNVPALFPDALGNYPGDALWAVVVFLGVALAKPAASVWSLAGLALGVSYLVEVSQLYQGSWITGVRDTSVGHLLLGRGFDRFDLVAQTVGVALGAVVDALVSWNSRGSGG
jgi:Protein of unknown function (DUF2809)